MDKSSSYLLSASVGQSHSAFHVFLPLLLPQTLWGHNAVQLRNWETEMPQSCSQSLRSDRARSQAKRHKWTHHLPQQQSELNDTYLAGSVWRSWRGLQAEVLNSMSVAEAKKYELNLLLKSQLLILGQTLCLTLLMGQMRLSDSVTVWMWIVCHRSRGWTLSTLLMALLWRVEESSGSTV